MMEPWETVQLTTVGKHKNLFIDILEESRQLGNKIYFFIIYLSQIIKCNFIGIQDNVEKKII